MAGNIKKRKNFSNSASFVLRTIALQKKRGGSLLRYFFRLIAAVFLDILQGLWMLLEGPLLLVLIVLLIGGLILFFRYKDDVAAYTAFADEIAEKSEPYDFRMDETTYLFDSEGVQLAKLSGGSESIYLNYLDIPKDAVNAFVAIEDRTFWTNQGMDTKGLLRVAASYVLSRGDSKSGASTITQQLVRTTYLTREVSLERKIKEILLAKRLTKKYSKEQIMEFYINSANFGNAIYGLEAAARTYFGVSAKDLTLGQTAYLCALPNRPTYFNPYEDYERAIPRQQKILRDMQSLGYITSTQCEKALAEKIEIKPKRSNVIADYNYETTYATDCAIRYLMELDGFRFRYQFRDDAEYEEYRALYDEEYELERTNLYSGGYKVYTSLDSEKQKGLQEIMDRQLEFEIEEDMKTGIFAFQGAMTAVDNETGKVIAVIGGRTQDFLNDTYALNRAYQGYRQPGSSIKPLVVYTPALMKGYDEGDTLQDIDIKKAQEEDVDIDRLTGSGYSLRNAVEQSRNGCAMYLLYRITPAYGVDFLREMEYDRILPSDNVLSTALGTCSVTTVQMAGGYAAIGNHGVFREPTCLVSMRDKDGRELYHPAEEKQVYETAASDQMLDIMRGVIKNGTAKSMAWEEETGMAAAGKTGTTNENKDGWFCGLTPYYTLTVWVGFDNPREKEDLTGASYPAGLWKEAMLYLIRDLPEKDFS